MNKFNNNKTRPYQARTHRTTRPGGSWQKHSKTAQRLAEGEGTPQESPERLEGFADRRTPRRRFQAASDGHAVRQERNGSSEGFRRTRTSQRPYKTPKGPLFNEENRKNTRRHLTHRTSSFNSTNNIKQEKEGDHPAKNKGRPSFSDRWNLQKKSMTQHSSKRPSFRMSFRGFQNALPPQTFPSKNSKSSLQTRNPAIAKPTGKRTCAACFDIRQLDPVDLQRNTVTLQHSALVAQAARLLAEHIEGLDPEKAFEAGLFHDFGKFYLPRGWVYRHPRLGQEMMQLLKADKPWLADVCLAHPFPVPENKSYTSFFCRGDNEEAGIIIDLLKKITPRLPSIDEPINLHQADPTGILIRLVQLCDKLAGLDHFVTLDEKFSWYDQWKTPKSGSDSLKNTNEGANSSDPSKAAVSSEAKARAINYDAWRKIKNQMDELINKDIYEILGISNSSK